MCYSLMHIDSQMEAILQSGRRVRDLVRTGRGSLGFVLLAVSLLFGVSTLEACHIHDTGPRRDGLAQVSAPADACPLCAMPYAAMAAETRTTKTAIPEAGLVLLPGALRVRAAVWSFELFSRPPPACSDQS